MQETHVDRSATRELRSRIMNVHFVIVVVIAVVLIGAAIGFAIHENFYADEEEAATAGNTTTTTPAN